MKKNNLGGQILYRSLDPSKKRRHREDTLSAALLKKYGDNKWHETLYPTYASGGGTIINWKAAILLAKGKYF